MPAANGMRRDQRTEKPSCGRRIGCFESPVECQLGISSGERRCAGKIGICEVFSQPARARRHDTLRNQRFCGRERRRAIRPNCFPRRSHRQAALVISRLEHTKQACRNLAQVKTTSYERGHALAKQRACAHIGFDDALLVRLDHRESACPITYTRACGADTYCHIFTVAPSAAAKEKDCLLIYGRGSRRQTQHRFHAGGETADKQDNQHGSNQKQHGNCNTAQKEPSSPTMDRGKIGRLRWYHGIEVFCPKELPSGLSGGRIIAQWPAIVMRKGVISLHGLPD